MLVAMRAVLCSLVLLVMQTLCMARESAYEAMRSLAAQQGQKVLAQLIELRGVTGEPQPLVWKMVIDDPMARGGVREFQIRQGLILSEKTPVSSYAGTTETLVIDITKLNLDSSGAFTVAEAEARRQKVGFDIVDYLLRRAENGAAAEWVLRLVSLSRGLVATVHIAADTGQIVLFEKAQTDFPPEVPRNDLEERTEAVRRTLNKTGNQIRDGALKGAGAIQEFFTGRRTIDRGVDR